MAALLFDAFVTACIISGREGGARAAFSLALFSAPWLLAFDVSVSVFVLLVDGPTEDEVDTEGAKVGVIATGSLGSDGGSRMARS